MIELFDLDMERGALAGLIKYPQIYADIASNISDSDFYHIDHQNIYSVLSKMIEGGEKTDSFLIAGRIKNYGIRFKDGVDIYDYIDTLSLMTKVSADGAIKSFAKIKDLRFRRDLQSTAKEVEKMIGKTLNEPIDTVLAKVDTAFSKPIISLFERDAPVNIFSDMKNKIEERGNNPIEEVGLATGYPEFNRLYGGLRDGNVYAFVARPGQGKSTLLSDLCFKTSQISDFKVKALILDTEMFTDDITFRMASSLTGVSTHYLETGKWRKNAQMEQKVRSVLNAIENKTLIHYHVRNKSIDEICSIARRWYYNEVGRGNPCIIGYDYIKLSGERTSGNWSETQAIGEKVDRLKSLSEDLHCPLISAMQMNRSGERGQHDNPVDDSSAIAMSDRLQWFASYIAIFRWKTPVEIMNDGGVDENGIPLFGTHKMIELKTRFQGRDAMGHSNFLSRPIYDPITKKTKYKLERNYLNFDVHNFNVKEKGSLFNVITHLTQKHNVQDGAEVNPHDDPNVNI